MSRLRSLPALLPPLAATACQMAAATCFSYVACRQDGAPSSWVHGLFVPFALAVLASSMLCVSRTLYRARQASQRVRSLCTVEPPPRLLDALFRTGVGTADCIDSSRPLAFCAGIVRPRVVISSGMVERLRPAELDAVLVHERDHAQRREPLRRLIGRCVSDVLFYLPLVRWWTERRAEQAELRADQVAAARCGRHALAGALWAVGTTGQINLVAFGGVTESRVAWLLDGTVLRRRPDRLIWTKSAVGALALIGIAVCLAQESSAFLS